MNNATQFSKEDAMRRIAMIQAKLEEMALDLIKDDEIYTSATIDFKIYQILDEYLTPIEIRMLATSEASVAVANILYARGRFIQEEEDAKEKEQILKMFLDARRIRKALKP